MLHNILRGQLCPNVHFFPADFLCIAQCRLVLRRQTFSTIRRYYKRSLDSHERSHPLLLNSLKHHSQLEVPLGHLLLLFSYHIRELVVPFGYATEYALVSKNTSRCMNRSQTPRWYRLHELVTTINSGSAYNVGWLHLRCDLWSWHGSECRKRRATSSFQAIQMNGVKIDPRAEELWNHRKKIDDL